MFYNSKLILLKRFSYIINLSIAFIFKNFFRDIIILRFFDSLIPWSVILISWVWHTDPSGPRYRSRLRKFSLSKRLVIEDWELIKEAYLYNTDLNLQPILSTYLPILDWKSQPSSGISISNWETPINTMPLRNTSWLAYLSSHYLLIWRLSLVARELTDGHQLIDI